MNEAERQALRASIEAHVQRARYILALEEELGVTYSELAQVKADLQAQRKAALEQLYSELSERLDKLRASLDDLPAGPRR